MFSSSPLRASYSKKQTRKKSSSLSSFEKNKSKSSNNILRDRSISSHGKSPKYTSPRRQLSVTALSNNERSESMNTMSKSSSTSNSNGSSSSSAFSSSMDLPKSLTFSPKNAGSEQQNDAPIMPTIDESQTKSKLEVTLVGNTHYDTDSMYSDDDDENHLQSPKSPALAHKRSLSMSMSLNERYKHFGPRIKLSAENSSKDVIRYSALYHSQKASKTNLNRAHVRNSSNFVMTDNALNGGYASDGSDNSDISQSYGVYLYDANYKSKMRHSISFRGPKLQEWDSELSVFSDSEHLPIADMSPRKSSKKSKIITPGSVVSTVVRGDESENEIGYGIIEFDDHMKTQNVDRRITAFDGNNNIELNDTQSYTMQKQNSMEKMSSIVNDDVDVNEPQLQLGNVLDLHKQQSSVILEDEEIDGGDIVFMDDKEFEAWKPQRLYTFDGDDSDDEMMKNQKIAMPLPAMEENIHEIMQDDIMKVKKRNSYMVKRAGYRSIVNSGDFDNDLLLTNIEAALDNNNDEIFSDNEDEENNIPSQTERKMKLLQIINGSLKKNIQKQTEQIQKIQTDNFDLKKEVEKYKTLLAEKDKQTEIEIMEEVDDMKVKEESANQQKEKNANVDIQSLYTQISSLKEQLEVTKHKLLQYQIFDQNSELDIDTLLSPVPDKDDDEKESEEMDWKSIETHIENGDETYIDDLIKTNKISINLSDEINCYKILEAATKYNQIEIVHKIVASDICVKLSTKALCHRFDDGYNGYTILMIAVTNGFLEIANDLLDYYECTAMSNSIYEYLNMTDKNGVTLLMMACQTDNIRIVEWVLNQYFNEKKQLKTLISATDNVGNNIFSGYIRTLSIENCIHEYAPLII